MRGPELFVLLVCLVSGSLARLSITSATPSGSIFRSGESMRLECSTNNPWFLCIWETPRKNLLFVRIQEKNKLLFVPQMVSVVSASWWAGK